VRELGEVCLYCFTPGKLAMDRDPIELVKAQIRGGADVIQLREKEMSKRERLELGLKIRELTRDSGVIFIVNDDLDLALILDADGLHLGQEDIPIRYARSFMKERLIGVSTHSEGEVRQALDEGADYIGFGPVFQTTTKDAPDPVVGIEMLERLRGLAIPYVAIGGIKEENLRQVVDAGCRRVAIISDILLAEDIEAKCKRLKTLLTETG